MSLPLCSHVDNDNTTKNWRENFFSGLSQREGERETFHEKRRAKSVPKTSFFRSLCTSRNTFRNERLPFKVRHRHPPNSAATMNQKSHSTIFQNLAGQNSDDLILGLDFTYYLICKNLQHKAPKKADQNQNSFALFKKLIRFLQKSNTKLQAEFPHNITQVL